MARFGKGHPGDGGASGGRGLFTDRQVSLHGGVVTGFGFLPADLRIQGVHCQSQHSQQGEKTGFAGHAGSALENRSGNGNGNRIRPESGGSKQSSNLATGQNPAYSQSGMKAIVCGLLCLSTALAGAQIPAYLPGSQAYDPAITTPAEYLGYRMEFATVKLSHIEIRNLIEIKAEWLYIPLDTGSGALANLNFRIKEDAMLGDAATIGLKESDVFHFILDEIHGYDTLTPDFVAGTINVDELSGAEDDELTLPDEYSLKQNYPNPFNPETVIEYNIPSATHVRLSVYNILGQRVTDVVDEFQSSGTHRAVWNGTDEFGREVESGVYFYRLTTTDFDMTRKMILMK
jgi:hypothetical protein